MRPGIVLCALKSTAEHLDIFPTSEVQHLKTTLEIKHYMGEGLPAYVSSYCMDSYSNTKHTYTRHIKDRSVFLFCGLYIRPPRRLASSSDGGQDIVRHLDYFLWNLEGFPWKRIVLSFLMPSPPHSEQQLTFFLPQETESLNFPSRMRSLSNSSLKRLCLLYNKKLQAYASMSVDVGIWTKVLRVAL